MSSLSVILDQTGPSIAEVMAFLGSDELPSDILDEAQALMLNRIRTRFLNTEAPDGTKWPVSEAAIARNFNGDTLFDTGNLFHSIQAFIAEGPVMRAIGTDVPYGIVHQMGLNGNPVREFLGFSDEDVALIEGLAIARIEEFFNG